MENIVHKKIVQEYYSERAGDYDAQKTETWKSKQGFNAEMLDEVVDVLGDLENEPLLEVGFGSGRIGFPLVRKIKTWLIGLDLSKEMLQLGKVKTSSRGGNLDLVLGDADHLPFTDMVFEAVICFSTMHYFPSPERSLKEFSRTLKEGGFLVYGDVALHELDDQGFLDRIEKALSKAHARYYRPSTIKKLLENNDFRVSWMKVVPYRKSFNSLMDDKGKYFDVEHKAFKKRIRKASLDERKLYVINGKGLTLFYALVTAQKWTLMN